MLKDLHPQGHQVQPTQEDQADPIEFSREGVKAGVESPNRLAGAGRSDLKPQHLKEAVGCKSPAAATVVLDKLTGLVNFLVAGEACPEVAPFLAGAPLYAGKKADGGVRPIAVGETLRRLVGKCCVGDSSIKDAVKQLLEPRQLGVGTRGGAEVLVRAANAIVQDHGHDPATAMLQIDFTNAFNSISRDKILLEVDALLRALSAYTQWSYEMKSHLWYEEVEILSGEGVQEVDPLGSFLVNSGATHTGVKDRGKMARSMPTCLVLGRLYDNRQTRRFSADPELP